MNLLAGMKVHLSQGQVIEAYAACNTGSRITLKTWYTIVRHANWEHAVDMLQAFGTAELLAEGSDRVAFNIAGKFKLICHYKFGKNKVELCVCWIGSNAQYKKLCGERKQYTENFDMSNLDEPDPGNAFEDTYPVRILSFLMTENSLKPGMFADIAGISTSMLTSIMNYRSNISDDMATRLGERFKINKEAFFKKQ